MHSRKCMYKYINVKMHTQVWKFKKVYHDSCKPHLRRQFLEQGYLQVLLSTPANVFGRYAIQKCRLLTKYDSQVANHLNEITSLLLFLHRDWWWCHIRARILKKENLTRWHRIQILYNKSILRLNNVSRIQTSCLERNQRLLKGPWYQMKALQNEQLKVWYIYIYNYIYIIQ